MPLSITSFESFVALGVNFAKGLLRQATRCFAALSKTLGKLIMTGLDLSVDEKLSTSYEPCQRQNNAFEKIINSNDAIFILSLID
jgi:hypothetical protein